MSTLALRNYGLVLPKNYVSIEKDEMEYIDGGWYLNHGDCVAIRAAIGLSASSYVMTVGVAQAALLIKTAAASIAAILSGAIPGLGAAIGLGIGAFIIANAVSIADGLLDEMIYKKGMDISIRFKVFIPYLKCSAR